MSTLLSNNCQINEPIDLLPMSTDSHDPIDNLIFTGFFNGFNVELRNLQDMELYKMGCFGKGSASRSRPVSQQKCIMMRKRQFQKRNEWYKKFCNATVKPSQDPFLQSIDKLMSKIIREGEIIKDDLVDLVSSEESSYSGVEDGDKETKVTAIHDKDNIAVVVPNSDSELDGDDCNYFKNMRAECHINQTKIQEKLMLTLQEAFFLVYGFGCLQVIDTENHVLNIEQCWDLFKETDNKFIPKYVVYHYFRSKGYIVKPGIKFGGDYLLYKCSPEIAHSDYVVVIKYENDEADWISTLGHVRMAYTTVKEILITEVVKPETSEDMPEGLKNYSVRITALTRNIGTINEDE